MKLKVTMVTVILIFLFTATLLNSQSYTFTTETTSKISLINTDIVFDFKLINVSEIPINVCIIRREEVIPSNWIGSMCFGINCLPPFIDSVESDPIPAHDTVDFSYHFGTDSIPATGSTTLFIRNTRILTDTMTFILTATSITGINDISESVKSYSLEQNYPNPFNPSTRISFSIPQREFVTLKVYDLMGREVSSLVNQELNSGNHNASFNSEGLSSGTYFYKLTAGSYTSVKKMLFLK